MKITLRHTIFVTALLVSGCGVFASYPTFRYRLQVEVETPLGVRAGSSVIEVSCSSSNTGIGWASGSKCNVKGEAVAVDLGGSKTMFALLTRPGYPEGAESYAFDAFLSDRSIHDNAAMVDILKAQSGVAALPRQHRSSDGGRPDNSPPTAYPMLVTFKNLANPKSVVAVDPDHLDSTFGPGNRLKRITVQMTEDSVTNGIEKRLRWLGTSVTGYLDGQFAGGGPALSNILDTTSFKQSN